MKHFMLLLQLTSLVLLQGLLTVKSENVTNNRKSVEFGEMRFLIDPNAKYTWKEAREECRKRLGTLINPLGTYDYSNLSKYIHNNFYNYSSFWTISQVKVPSFFAQLAMGKSKHGELKCKYFERTTFKHLQDDCDTLLGFICEKPLKKGSLFFHNENKRYIIQTDKEYTCEEAHGKCDDLQMSLVTYNKFDGNTVLKNYITTHYGETPRFWLGDSESSGYICDPSNKKEKVNFRTKFGYICVGTISKASISTRYLVLIMLMSTAAITAVIVLCAVKCCFNKVKSGTYVTDIPEPVKRNSIMNF